MGGNRGLNTQHGIDGIGTRCDGRQDKPNRKWKVDLRWLEGRWLRLPNAVRTERDQLHAFTFLFHFRYHDMWSKIKSNGKRSNQAGSTRLDYEGKLGQNSKLFWPFTRSNVTNLIQVSSLSIYRNAHRKGMSAWCWGSSCWSSLCCMFGWKLDISNNCSRQYS